MDTNEKITLPPPKYFKPYLSIKKVKNHDSPHSKNPNSLKNQHPPPKKNQPPKSPRLGKIS